MGSSNAGVGFLNAGVGSVWRVALALDSGVGASWERCSMCRGSLNDRRGEARLSFVSVTGGEDEGDLTWLSLEVDLDDWVSGEVTTSSGIGRSRLMLEELFTSG